MASAARRKRKREENPVYPVEKERQDWSIVWVALRSFRTFSGHRRYRGLDAAHERAGDALNALMRLNDHRATK